MLIQDEGADEIKEAKPSEEQKEWYWNRFHPFVFIRKSRFICLFWTSLIYVCYYFSALFELNSCLCLFKSLYVGGLVQQVNFIDNVWLSCDYESNVSGTGKSLLVIIKPRRICDTMTYVLVIIKPPTTQYLFDCMCFSYVINYICRS